MKDLYYEITDNGWHIYDRNDEFFHIHQYEPYVLDKTKSYEENAQRQIYGLMVDEYALLVYSGELSMDEVPEKYREGVTDMVEILKSGEESEPVDSDPTIESRVEVLEDALAQTDETAIALFEAQMEQEEINIAQDEALIEIYEMIGG